MAENQLILGDGISYIKSKDFAELCEMQKVIIVTDPPFNINYHYDSYKDNLSQNDYLKMIKDVCTTQEIPFVLIHYPESLYRISAYLGIFPSRVCSWVYNSNTQKQHRDIAFFNIVPDFKKVGQPYKNPKDKRIAKRIAEGKQCKLYDWWEINQVKNVSKEKTKHPCQMPLKVMTNIIGMLPEDATILDPFMGSGTTGVACQMLNRKFIGVELDETYYEIAFERLRTSANGL